MSSRLPGKHLTWIFIAVLCLVIVVIIGAGSGFYEHQKRQLEVQESAEVQAVADLKVRQIAAWRQERLADARVVAASPFLAEHLRHLMEQPQELPCRDELLGWLRTVKEQYHYHDILLLNKQGDVLLSVGTDTWPRT